VILKDPAFGVDGQFFLSDCFQVTSNFSRKYQESALDLKATSCLSPKRMPDLAFYQNIPLLKFNVNLIIARRNIGLVGR
jgi:hypothetical protein